MVARLVSDSRAPAAQKTRVMSVMIFSPGRLDGLVGVVPRAGGARPAGRRGAHATLIPRRLQTVLLVIALPGWYKTRPGNRWGTLLDSKLLKSLKVSVCPASARSLARSPPW